MAASTAAAEEGPVEPPVEDEPQFYRFGLAGDQVPMEASECGYGVAGQKKPIPGMLYVSADFLCFGGAKIPDEDLMVCAFSDIGDVVLKKNGAFSKVLEIEFDGERHWFHNLARKDEIVSVVDNFWKAAGDTTLRAQFESQVTIYTKQQLEAKEQERALAGNDPDPVLMQLNNESDDEELLFGEGGRISNDGRIDLSEAAASVDQDQSRKNIALANQTRQIGAATLTALNEQGEQIQHAKIGVEMTNNELARGERSMRSIDTLRGATANKLTRNPNKARSGKSLRELCSFLDLDIPVVRINEKGKYQPRVIRLGQTEFYRVLVDGGKEKIRSKWSYNDVARVSVGAVPQRIVVRFKKDERLCLISAFADVIQHELTRRSSNFVEVRYAEPAVVNKPDGGIVAPVAASSTTGSGRPPPVSGFTSRAERQRQREANRVALLAESEGGGSGSVSSRGRGDEENIDGGKGKNPLQQQVQEDEQNVEELSQILGDLKGMATAMGDTIDRQNAELDELTDAVDRTNNRLHRDNKKLIKMNRA